MNLNFENPTILKSLLSNTREFHFVSQKMFKLSKIDEGNDEEFNFSEHLNTSLLSLSLFLSTFPTSTTIIKSKICKGQKHAGVPYTVQLLPIYSRL